jgi:uncharacterized protein (TIGR00299 family) protein
MTRVAYLDLANGVSGDMTLACLAHAGRRTGVAVEDAIADAVSSIPLEASVTFVDDERGGITCLRAEVKTTQTRHTANELRAAIEATDIAATAKDRALRALEILVAAEARVHGVDADEVHLHELASADTAADLVGAAVGFEALRIERVAAAAVPVPTGWIRSGHGPLPVPAPATLEILLGARLRGVDMTDELVTPSGAAILVAHEASFGPAPEMVLETVGVGAGSRIGDRPNVCRVLIGNATVISPTCVLLEANIDDQTPESLGYAIERLIAEGALDAWVQPIVMKKSRPAFLFSVLVGHDDEARITESFFRNTTTLGVRRREVERTALDRGSVTVSVEGLDVSVKIGRLDGEVVGVAPEFDDCVRVAEATGLSLKDVFAKATELAEA